MEIEFTEKSNAGPRSISRVLRLLDLLAHETKGMTLSQLSVSLDVSKSTLLASLTVLVSGGFLLDTGKVYTLGPSVFRLAGRIMASSSLPEIIRRSVRDLARVTNESAGFAIADWKIGQVIYTDAANSTQPVHYAMRVGVRAPLYASAAGRVLLAYAPSSTRNNYLRKARIRRLTPATRTTQAEIKASLNTIVEQGYCASFGEMLHDTGALSVPIFDVADTVIGALIVAAPLSRMEANYTFMLRELIRYGDEASRLVPSESAFAQSSFSL